MKGPSTAGDSRNTLGGREGRGIEIGNLKGNEPGTTAIRADSPPRGWTVDRSVTSLLSFDRPTFPVALDIGGEAGTFGRVKFPHNELKKKQSMQAGTPRSDSALTNELGVNRASNFLRREAQKRNRSDKNGGQRLGGRKNFTRGSSHTITESRAAWRGFSPSLGPRPSQLGGGQGPEGAAPPYDCSPSLSQPSSLPTWLLAVGDRTCFTPPPFYEPTKQKSDSLNKGINRDI
ncbi:hypothetical protein J6590_013139 [Homalodisca vitripennis]|nr:hypothetical protein J6590_013139 [Homalodisca vitripennis]